MDISKIEYLITKYEKILNYDKNNIEALFNLAILYDEKNEFTKSEEFFAKLLKLEPYHQKALIYNALFLIKWDKIDLSIELFKRYFINIIYDFAIKHTEFKLPMQFPEKLKIALDTIFSKLKQSPHNTKYLISLAFLYMVSNKYEESLQIFDKIHYISSDYVLSYFYESFIYLLQNKFNDAINCLRKGEDINPNIFEINVFLGLSYYKKGMHSIALKHFKRALYINSKSFLTYLGLANILQSQFKLDEALEILKKGILVNSQDYVPYYYVGLLYEKKYEYDKALKYYKQALQLSTINEKLHQKVGFIYKSLGKIQEAVLHFQKYCDFSPNDTEAFYNLALSYIALKDYKNAKKALERASQLNPRDSYIFYNLGLVHSQLNDYDNAILSYKKALKINPRQSDTYKELGWIYMKLGNLEEAKKQFLQALKLNPNDGFARYNLATTYGISGYLDKAIQEYKKANELDPDNPYSHFALGAVYAREGNLQEAEKEFKFTLSLSPKTKEELSLFAALSAQATVNLDIAKRHKQLENIYINTVRALAKAIDAKDPYTAGHTERVAMVSLEIAKSLNLEVEKLFDGKYSEIFYNNFPELETFDSAQKDNFIDKLFQEYYLSNEDLSALKMAAYLHDIGKIGIPEKVLLKPGRLTPEEYEIIKKHTTIGAKILEPIDFPWRNVPDLVKHHHEKVNGKGYPDGLTKDQLLIGARILAVVDVFDALATARPYKPALPAEKIIDILTKDKNEAFDPIIVDILLGMLDEILLKVYAGGAVQFGQTGLFD